MQLYVKQINSLEKVRLTDELNHMEIFSAKVLKGERFSYQIALHGPWALLGVSVESELKDYIKIYSVENSPMDYTVYDKSRALSDDDYITKEPGLMPDILVPFEETGAIKLVEGASKAIWVRCDVPKGISAGKYDIKISFKSIVKDGLGNAVGESSEGFDVTKTFTLNIVNAQIPEHEIIYTQWFHADCIADYYKVPIYSKRHWELIESYIKTAVETGINMLLMPVITPPLDTMPGTARPCVQLVDIKKADGKYTYNFDKTRKWISICKKYGIKYYEISHLFSQWGSEFSPNIMIEENGEKKYLFTWGISSDSTEYTRFLKSFIPELVKVLKQEKIEENTFFHISDEPRINHIEAYEKSYRLIKSLIGSIKTVDALSDYSFYEKGLVECPVTCTNSIDEFLKHKVYNQWVYYCCGQINKLSNRLLSMPSYRNRIMGVQMYKHQIKGFLHWGYNFYNSELSAYKINPYKTTSGDSSFPSGDAFSVYPGENGALLSLRALVFYEGLQDICVLKLLEEYIGFEKVKNFIEDISGMGITFEDYPRNSSFLPKLRQKAIEMIEKYIQ